MEPCPQLAAPLPSINVSNFQSFKLKRKNRVRLRLRSMRSLVSSLTFLTTGIALTCYFFLIDPPANPNKAGDMAGILQPLKSVIVEPLTKHTATVVFIHGLGDTGHGWKPVADMFKTDPALSHIKWVLPHAPIMPVTANMGMEMPSWFDLYEFGFRAEEDEKGMLKSTHAINQLITAEVDAGVPANRIVLGGFSQGGGLTLLTGLTSERTLAGLVVLSGWSPIPAKLKVMATDNTRKLPIFWGHGKEDPLIKFQFAQRSVEFLKSGLGIKDADSAAPEKGGLIFRAYDGLPHSTDPNELRDLKEWLKKIVPNQS